MPPNGVIFPLQALAPGSDTKLDAATLEAAAGSAPSAELPYDQACLPYSPCLGCTVLRPAL
jgi:hypothetical protein